MFTTHSCSIKGPNQNAAIWTLGSSLSSNKASGSFISLSLFSLYFFILSKIHRVVTLSTMVFCGAQLPIKQERACGVMSQFNSFHCSLPVVWHSQAIGLEVKAAEMKEPSQKLGKAPSA